MTKAEQALAIYQELAKNTDDKQMKDACVDRFINELGMTKSGATTYFYNSKKKANGGEIKSYYKGRDLSDPSSDKADSRQIYSIVNELDGKVESTESSYHLKSLKQQANGRIVVKGMPELESPIGKLKVL